MKKVFILTVVFILCLTTLGYAKDINLDFIENASLNSTCTGSMTITVDKPLEVITVLEKNGYLDEINKYIDLRAFAESISGTDISFNCKINANRSYTKMRAAIEYDVYMPTVINPNLKMDITAKNGLWIDYDVTGDTPLFDMTVKCPYLNKYLHITEKDSGGREAVESLKFFYGEENNFIDTVKGIMAKYADVSVSGGTYTVKFDEKAIGGIIKEYFEKFSDNFNAYLEEKYQSDFAAYDEGGEADEEAVEYEVGEGLEDFYYEDGGDFGSFGQNDFLSGFESIGEVFNKISFLGEDGITVKYVKGSGGKLKSAEEIIPVRINLYQLLTALEADIPEGLSEENSNIAFTVKETAEYKNVGTVNKIDFPKLTEENSFSPEDYSAYNGYYEYEKRTDFDTWINIQSDSLIKEGEAVYVPFREAIENACSYAVCDEGDEDNPYYSLDYADGWISFRSRLADFGVLEFKVGRSDCYYKDGTYNFAAPKLINGRVWVDVELFEEIFGWELESMNWDYITSTMNVGFSNYDFE